MKKIKTIEISILVAACAACLSLAFVACKGGDKNASGYGAGEEGMYYYDATGSSTRYMLSLYSGSYMLAMGDVITSTGTYSFDEGTRTITFSGSDEKFSAGVAENVLSMDITDSGYTFLRYVYFDVTFRNADGTVLTTQSVLNGKAAEPVDCELDGYYFIDWYEDAALSGTYGFNTSVTADTDIYGWYVEKNPVATDFWVTYDFGSGYVTEPVKTQNGKIYSLPTADGLLGWWMSDTNNGDELTRRYEAGTVLDSDTTLFAVYDAEGAMGASVADGWVTWEKAVGSDVTVTVYSGETAVLTASASSSNFKVSVGDLSTGTYTVVVRSGGYTETLVYVVNGLARVSGFEILNGTVISFNPVANATGYTIEITNGVRTETVDLGNSTVYNISGWEMTAEGLSFSVTARAAGYADSVSDVHNYTAVLDTVVISIEDDKVQWGVVENATYYEVRVTVNGETVEFSTYYTTVSLKNYDCGDVIVVSVRPVASGYYSEATVSGTYTKASLAAPVIENVIDGIITWSRVEGANGYTVSINGVTVTLDGEDVTSFATSDSNFVDGQGTYTVMVRALGTNSGASSDWSDAVVITEKEMGKTLTYGNGTVSWQYSFAASSYIVQVNNGDENVVTYGNTANVTLDKAGDNEITVYFLDGEGAKSAAASITVFAYEIVLDAREEGSVSTNVLYVATGDEIVLPDAVSGDAGLTFDAWYTLPDYDLTGYEYAGRGVKMESGTVFTGGSAMFLYAYYTPAEFEVTISYTVDGVETKEAFSVYYKRPFNLPVIEGTGDCEGEMFAGWYSDKAAKNQVADYTGYGASYPFTEDMTLYAGWYNYLTYTLVEVDGVANAGYAVSKGPDIAAIPTDEVTIPETYKNKPVVQLQSNAFRNCTWITTLNIPDTVTYIAMVNNGYSSGSGAFAGCAGLKNVNVYATDRQGEIVYYSEDGVLFRYDAETEETELIYYPWGRSGSYVVPETVSNENEYVYSGNTEVRVVRTVDAIGTQVFVNNTKITSVTIPATVSVIYSQAFYGCTKLTKVTFLEDDEGRDATLRMETGVFQGCTALTTVTLPSHMVDFDSTVFSGCSKLETLAMEKDGGSYTVRDGFLCDAAGMEIVYCAPGRCDVAISDARLTAIGENVFAGNTGIEEVVIPAWVTRIGAGAFEGCTGITSLTFMGTEYSNALTIETKAFYGCTGLTSVVLPANLKTLGAYAFGGCSKLTYVEVYTAYSAFGDPDFADRAFGTDAGTSTYYVTSLYISGNTGVMDIAGVFGSGLEYIEIGGIEGTGSNGFYSVIEDVIYNAAETELIFFPEDKEEFVSPDALVSINNSAFRGKTALETVVIGAKVETIADYAFYGCTGLTSVTFAAAGNESDAAQELIIGAHAFEGCSGLLTGDGEESMSMILPSNLVSIGDYAFNGCASLTAITIPQATSRIGEYSGNTLVSIYHVFDGCSSLEEIIVEDGNGSFYSYGGVLYSATKDVIYYTPAAHTGNVEFVNEELGLEIEQIWSYAFSGCTNLTTIEIPETVTFIGVNAFYGCANLVTLTFADGEGEVTLEDGTSSGSVFMNLKALTTVTLSGRVTTIPDYSFYGDDNITSISVPDAVERIGAYAFYNNNALVTFTIGASSSLKEIGENSLYGTGITSISLPEGLESIGDYAFYNAKLTRVTIPSTTTYVGNNAFKSCSSLTTISFAEYTGSDKTMTVTIGDSSFASCTKLEEVGFPSVSTVLGKSVFSSSKITNSDGGDGEGNTWGKIELPGTIVEMGSGIFSSTTVDEIHFAEDFVLDTIPDMFGSSDSGGVKYVNIPASVKTISNNAFYWGLDLVRVTFDEGCQLETIGDSAFAYCSFDSMEIPATVTYIGNNAFEKFSSAGDPLTKITFEDGSRLEYIGDYAFQAQSLVEVSLPESTSAIEMGTGVFKNNKSLTTVYISSSVYTMTKPFDGCTSLTSVTVAEDSKYFATYESSKNIVYKIESTGEEKIAFMYGVMDSDGKLDLSETSLTTIEYGLFNGDTSIKSIVFPDTLQVIEDNAFYGCRGITSITMPSCVTIGNHAFDAGSSIDDTGKEGNGSFNSGLTSIEFPANLESIGDYAFYNCYGLATVTFADGCSLKSIGAYAFTWYQSSNDYHLKITSLSLPDGLEYIGSYAFRNDTALTSCDIPESVTYLGTGVFYGCSALTKATLPKSMTRVADYLYYDCSAVVQMDIEWENIKEVGSYAFYGCSSVTGLSAGELVSVESVGDYAFDGLSLSGELELVNTSYVGALAFAGTDIEKVTIGPNLSDIGDRAFCDCSSLTCIDVDAANKAFYSAFDGILFDSAKRLICCPAGYEGEIVLGEDDITELVAYAFYGCDKVTKIALPVTVTSIPNYAFAYCSSLTGFEIPESVTTIGSYAFLFCMSLEKIEIPASVTSMGTEVFSCSLDNTRDALHSALKTVTFAENSKLTAIPSYAFFCCDSIESVTLPSSITSLGNYCFANCTSLKNFTFNEGLVYIERYAFNGCTSLEEAILPSTCLSSTNSAYGIFSGCTSLRKVELNEGISIIDQYMFQNCSNLEELNIPSTVTDIKRQAFDGCGLKTIDLDTGTPISVAQYGFQNSGFTEVTIPGTVTFSSTYAFSGSTQLETVVIEDGVTNIPNYTFSGCTALKSVTLPQNPVTGTTLGTYVFQNDTNISSIIIPSTTILGNYCFYGWTSSQTIYCEAASQPSSWSSNWNKGGNSSTSTAISSTVLWYSETDTGSSWHYVEVDGVLTPSTDYSGAEDLAVIETLGLPGRSKRVLF